MGRRRILMALLVLGTGSAARAEPEQARPEPEPDAPEPAPQEPSTAEELRELRRSLERLSDRLRDVKPEPGGAADKVEHAVVMAEVAVRLLEANVPTGMGWHWSVGLGSGAEQEGGGADERRAIGEVTAAAGIKVTGPTCPFLDAAAVAAFTTARGLSASERAELCLGGFQPAPEEDPRFTAMATRASESAAWNVRPPVDMAPVVDAAPFSTAAAGLESEGLRYHYAGDWSVAGLWVAMNAHYLTQSVGGDHRSVHRTGVALWVAEWRVHRPDGALTDGALQVLRFEGDVVHSGAAPQTIAVAPVEVIGLGTHGVYLDASGGAAFTADDDGATTDDGSTKPEVLTGTWNLALRAGAPWLWAKLASRRQLMAVLDGSAVVERRTTGSLHLGLRSVELDLAAFRASADVHGAEGRADRTVDSWGARGALSRQLGRHLVAGASLEMGRSFAFGEPDRDLPATARPGFGYRALVSLRWVKTRVMTLEELD